jgi:rhodanese-related sulfurtransferase
MPAFPLSRTRMDIVTFVGNHPALVAAAVTLAAMIVYVEARLLTRGSSDLGLVQAIQLLNADALVVDVRSPERFQTGHIAGARNVPFERLSDEADKRLGQAKDRAILTYCDNGASGARAASLLKKLGFARVFNLRGGLDAWRRESYPLERK